MKDREFQQWLKQVEARFPIGYVDHRLKLETRIAESIFQSESHIIGKWANARKMVTLALRALRLSRKGAENALDIKLTHNTVPVTSLPVAFNNFKILHISDPHFNDHDGFLEKLVHTIQKAEFDCCVLTGDYRFRSFGSSAMAMKGLAEIARVVNTDIVAVLGNHDSLKVVPEIERLGISVLVNEHIKIKRGRTNLLIAGVDDPRYYRTDDIDLSLKGVDSLDSIPSILLAHSPELYVDAARAGFDAYFCGHTHAGQICLIPGKTLIKNFRSPGWTLAGSWFYDGMNGYTSAGVGTSVVNARFNCSPEITIHTLCAAPASQ